MVANCHCTHCQRQSGAAFSTNVVFPREAFDVSGESLREYETTGTDNGAPVRRLFCSECGSPIASLASYLPDVALVKIGTLDDSSGLEPSMDAWTSSALPWVDLDETGRTQLDRGPK